MRRSLKPIRKPSLSPRCTTATAATVLIVFVASCAGSAAQQVATDRTTDSASFELYDNEIAQTEPIVAPPVAAPPTPIEIPPTPTPVPTQTRTLLFSGDVLSHTPVIAQARAYGNESDLTYDYRPMFAAVSERVTQADLAICVLETPVSADNIGLDGYPTFEAPRELPDALVDAGYDGCATASNHSMDRGVDGIHVTLDQMDRVSLGHAGMARTRDEALAPRLYDLDGVVVAHLSYTYSLNGFILPVEEPWLVNLNDVDAILTEAERARDAGANFVVLSIQWGNEYQQEPSAEQERLALELTRSGLVDLIVGNHVHVVQPVTTVNGVPVIYGLGNSLSNQSDNCCRTGTQDGVMIHVQISGTEQSGYEVTELTFAPTWVDRSNYTIIDLLKARDEPSVDERTQAIYSESIDRTIAAIRSLGYELRLAD